MEAFLPSQDIPSNRTQGWIKVYERLKIVLELIKLILEKITIKIYPLIQDFSILAFTQHIYLIKYLPSKSKWKNIPNTMKATAVPHPETNSIFLRLSPFLTNTTPMITPSNPAVATITAAARAGSNSKPIRLSEITSSWELKENWI